MDESIDSRDLLLNRIEQRHLGIEHDCQRDSREASTGTKIENRLDALDPGELPSTEEGIDHMKVDTILYGIYPCEVEFLVLSNDKVKMFEEEIGLSRGAFDAFRLQAIYQLIHILVHFSLLTKTFEPRIIVTQIGESWYSPTLP